MESSIAEIGDCDDDRPRADGKRLRAEKQQKWQAKQARINQETNKFNERDEWICRHARCCTQVSLEDVERVKNLSKEANGDDELTTLLRPYIDLKDGPKQRNSQETLFIAEGTETVRLLIQQTSRQDALVVKSVFVKPATLFDPPVQLVHDIEHALTTHSSPPFRVLVANEATMSAIAGFQISRGALACGVVPKRDEAWLLDYISSRQQEQESLRLLACDSISDSANMGSMIRCAAAFGVTAMILSGDCCDAWYRRSVRVSMGYIFQLPIIRVDDLSCTLQRLNKTASVVSYAAVIDSDADLVLEEMNQSDVSRSWCCVMGNEGNGISHKVAQACSHRLRIKMATGVDSLSVPIATGILLHGLVERETKS